MKADRKLERRLRGIILRLLKKHPDWNNERAKKEAIKILKGDEINEES